MKIVYVVTEYIDDYESGVWLVRAVFSDEEDAKRHVEMMNGADKRNLWEYVPIELDADAGKVLKPAWHARVNKKTGKVIAGRKTPQAELALPSELNRIEPWCGSNHISLVLSFASHEDAMETAKGVAAGIKK